MTMPQLISESLMEATWQAVGAMSPAQALRLQQMHGTRQQELTAFVVAYSSELRAEVGALVIYIFVVLVEAFHRSGARLRKIKPAKVLREWQAVSELVGTVADIDDPRASELAKESSEPAGIRYVLDALGPDQEDPMLLTDEEFRQSFSILLTVIRCLHDGQKTR